MPLEPIVTFSAPVEIPDDGEDWNRVIFTNGEYSAVGVCEKDSTDPEEWAAAIDQILPGWRTFSVYAGGFDQSRMVFLGRQLCWKVKYDA